MPVRSSDDFTIHTKSCAVVGSGMPISDRPDQGTSIDDLECECWSGFDSLDEI